MPLVWRYLIRKFLLSFCLTISSLVAIILVTRLKEIAKFAAISNEVFQTFLFILYQIPLVLPLLLPISAVIASFMIATNLSKHNELTSLRATGFDLSNITYPLALIFLTLGGINFTITATITPHCKSQTRNIIQTQSTANPLTFLQKITQGKMKKQFVQINSSQKDSSHKDALIILPLKKQTSLILLENIACNHQILTAESNTCISYISEKNKPAATLSLDTQENIKMDTLELLKKFEKKESSLDEISLNIPMLRLQAAHSKKKACKAMQEILSRISMSIAAFTLPLMGWFLGIQTSRHKSKKEAMLCTVYILLFLSCYFLGAHMKYLTFSSLLLFSPHVLLLIASYKRIQKIEKGLV